jgi:hypothetical protein
MLHSLILCGVVAHQAFGIRMFVLVARVSWFDCAERMLISTIAQKTELTIDTVLARLGLTYNTHYPLSHLPILLLFIGPIYCASLAENLPLQRHWNFSTHLLPLFGSWQGVRNFIVAPITEEIVFRGCVLAVYHLAGAGKMRMVFLSPLSFGLGEGICPLIWENAFF